MHLTDCSAKDRRVLAVDIDQVIVNQAITGDDTIRRSLVFRQVEISAAGSHTLSDFNETVFVKQGFDSFRRTALCCIAHAKTSI